MFIHSEYVKGLELEVDMSEQESQRKLKADHNVRWGALWLLGGLLVTMMNYVFEGEQFVIAWGAMLFGGIQMLRGLFASETRDSDKADSWFVKDNNSTEQVFCPNCREELELDQQELDAKHYVCPMCNSSVNMSVIPSQDQLPPEVVCPHCGDIVELDERERVKKKFICPECNAAINYERIIKTNTPKVHFDVELDISYVPQSVTRFVRPISKGEYWVLRNAVGLFRPRAIAEEKAEVEVLQMRALAVWYLNPCGPDCCAPHLVFQIGETDYLVVGGKNYSHGGLLAEGEDLKPLHRNLEVVRSLTSHTLLGLEGTGETMAVQKMRFSDPNEPLVFAADLLQYSCEFFQSNQLPEAFHVRYCDVQATCPNCGEELELDYEEKTRRAYCCPECGKQASF